MPFWDTMLDIIFPAKCLGCQRAGALLCGTCFAEFPIAERDSAKWIFPLYDYRHPLAKKALWSIKYGGKKALAALFAGALYEKIAEELADIVPLQNFGSPLLVPIPLSKKRNRERGFNQSKLLCEEILKVHRLRQKEPGDASIELAGNILIKPNDTEHQARIRDKRARQRNITGSFTAINTELLKGRNVILIDDILTTGATLSEAKKVLKAAGARKIIAFTVAH